MTQEEKSILLKDLCARLPYGIKVCSPDKKICSIWSVPTISVVSVINGSGQSSHPIEDIKPYLRPMSSMTEEEKRKFQSFYPGAFGNQWLDVEKGSIELFECSSTLTLYLCDNVNLIDWLNAHHFDFHNLIERKLALKAPTDMYKKED